MNADRAMPLPSTLAHPGPMRQREAWIVRVNWSDSSPTYHGPFESATDAERWADAHFDVAAAVDGWHVGLLSAVSE